MVEDGYLKTDDRGFRIRRLYLVNADCGLVKQRSDVRGGIPGGMTEDPFKGNKKEKTNN